MKSLSESSQEVHPEYEEAETFDVCAAKQYEGTFPEVTW